jgi:uncharacterized protein (TIGR02271 family)
MVYEKIVSVFDTPQHAQQAVDALSNAGFATADMHAISKDEVSSIDSAAGKAVREPGFWHRILGSEDVVEYEGHVFGRAVDGGGTVLTLRAPKTDAPRAVAILNTLKPVDIENRATKLGLLPTTAMTPAPQADEVVRLAEEQLQVGKRQVDAGTTTVRRYVVERPVEAAVTLHEEHADVVRRAITDPAYVGDIDWADKTVVVTETAEQPVVNKVARIAEEVVIRRAASDRVEKIADTVRRQQVEVGRQSPGQPKP